MKKYPIIIFILFFAILIVFSFIKEPQKDNRIIIRFSSWGSQSETKILKQLINKYEEEKNIKIEFIHIPQNYFQKIHLLFASGLEPDVVFMNNQHIQKYIKANLIEDISSYINSEDFYEEALNCFKYKNGIYAFPRDISTLVIYYNKEILSKAGINPHKTIYDLKTFINALKEIKKQNIYGINYEADSLYWSYYLAANGGGIISDKTDKLIITTQESKNAIKLYSDMINKYKIMPSKAEIGSKTTAQMFINKEIAMYLGGRWMVPKFREVIDFDWDIMEFPTLNNNKLYSDASGWAISSKSKHKREAIEFVKYLSNENSLKEMANSGLIIPANKNAAKWLIKNDKNKKPKNSEIFLKMLNRTKPTPVNEHYASINDIINEKAEIIFSGQKTVEEVFDNRTIKKIESYLK